MGKINKFFCTLIFSTVILSCSSFQQSNKAEATTNMGPNLPDDSLAVPLVRQSTSYSCGAAAMLSVLSYWQVYDGDESSLFAPLNTTSENGTDPLNMAKVAKEMGLKATIKTKQTWEDLENDLEQGQTIIVNYQAWHESGRATDPVDYSKEWEDGHYSVVIAINGSTIFLMDPSLLGGYGYLSKKDFLSRWHDYEIRQGVRIEHHQLAIYIKGTKRNIKYPLNPMAIE